MRRPLTALLALASLAGCGSASAEWLGPLHEGLVQVGLAAPVVTPHRVLAATNVRAAPSVDAPILGGAAAGAVVGVHERSDATPRCEAGWGRIGPEHWMCLHRSEPTDAPPTPLPSLLPFDPPEPEESAAYLRTGTWERSDGPEAAILPFVYGRRWLRWSGTEYDDLDAFLRGEESGALGGYKRYAFEAVVPTERGEVLRRPGGGVVPLDEVHVYPTSRFRGVELAIDPPPDDTTPAWAVATRGVDVHATPDADADVAWRAAFHHPLWAEPPRDDGWRRVIDRTDAHAGGWVAPGASVRAWSPAPPPPDLPEDALWIDVDLEQQALAVLHGDLPLYVTLVSTGKRGDETQVGLFSVYDKAAWWDMASLPESTRPYHLERVPWVAHFAPRYALHGAFWHDRFGHVVSHGCINVAPRDAAWLFPRLAPDLPDGMWWVRASDEGERTVLRVRNGAMTEVPDRR